MKNTPFQLRGRHKQLPRCPHCALHQPLCICDAIKPIQTRSHITLLIHIKEWKRTSNSGRWLDLCLENADVRIRGEKNRPMLNTGLCRDGFRNVVLFPSEHAVPLTEEWVNSDERPVHLLIPDGNWRQAARTVKRVSALPELPHVCLAPGSPSRFRLRSHPDVSRVCTFEATARALGITDSKKTQNDLEKIFDMAVERTLWSRGILSAENVSGGIPKAAF